MALRWCIEENCGVTGVESLREKKVWTGWCGAQGGMVWEPWQRAVRQGDVKLQWWSENGDDRRKFSGNYAQNGLKKSGNWRSSCEGEFPVILEIEHWGSVELLRVREGIRLDRESWFWSFRDLHSLVWLIGASRAVYRAVMIGKFLVDIGSVLLSNMTH